MGGNGTIGKAVAAELLAAPRDRDGRPIERRRSRQHRGPRERARSVRPSWEGRGRRVCRRQRALRSARVDDSAGVRDWIARQTDGSVNLVLVGREFVEPGGSFTLISGILSRDPIRFGASRVDGQRRDRELRARGSDRTSQPPYQRGESDGPRGVDGLLWALLSRLRTGCSTARRPRLCKEHRGSADRSNVLL